MFPRRVSVQFGAYRPGCLCVIYTRKAMIPPLIWCLTKIKKSKKKRKHYLLFLCCVLSAHLPHVRAPLGDWTSRNGMRGPGTMSQTVDGRTLRSKIGSREAFHRASWRKWAPATTLQFKTGLRRATKKKRGFKTIWDSTASANDVTDGVWWQLAAS